MVTTPSFGAWLKQRRRALDLTQEELADQVGCSIEMIYKIEADARRPSKQIAQRLADALELPPGEKSDFVRFARGGAPLTGAATVLAAQPGALDLPHGSPFNHLPMPPTTFVGQEREKAALRALLEQQHVRLLTLTGPGGIGKTRLALEVARDLVDAFSKGVVFVPLVSITKAQIVALAIAQAFGLEEHSGQRVEELLKTALRDKCLQLILDNFEHVLAAAPAIAELLAAAPRLHVLVTSRALLHISGEHEYPVPPLRLPDDRQDSHSLEHLLACSAVTLFVDRARAAHLEFQLTQANAPDVVALCRQLDGLPLAIELLSARIKFFSPGALVRRLQQSPLALLSDGAQDVPARQQTLRATIAWSYALLSPAEQTLFTRVAVFAGGCTIEAADAVCNTEGQLDILAGLIALANHSLLQQQQGPDGEPRFYMLETIREYALEQLAAYGERAELEQRYADYFVALAEQAEPELLYEVGWVQLLEREYNNLRAVLAWSVAQARPDIGMRLSGALWQFWYFKGHITEGRLWFDRILDGSDAIVPAIRAKAIDGAGVMAMLHGQYMEAQRHHEVALQLYRELGEPRGIAGNLESLGHIRLHLRDYQQALVFYEEGLKIRREANDLSGIASSLSNLGSIAFFQGNYRQDQDYIEEALQISRTTGNIQQTIMMLSNLAALACHQKQFDRALQLYKESLEINHQLESKDCITMCVEGIAIILVATNSLELAAVLFGAVAQLRAVAGLLGYNQSHDQIVQTMEDTRQQLGDTWDELWNKGWAMSIDQVVTYVLSLSLSKVSPI